MPGHRLLEPSSQHTQLPVPDPAGNHLGTCPRPKGHKLRRKRQEAARGEAAACADGNPAPPRRGEPRPGPSGHGGHGFLKFRGRRDFRELPLTTQQNQTRAVTSGDTKIQPLPQGHHRARVILRRRKGRGV